MPSIFVQLKLIHSSLKPFLSTKVLKTKFKVRTKRFIGNVTSASTWQRYACHGHGWPRKFTRSGAEIVSLLNSISVFCVRQKTIQSWPMSLWNSFYIRMSRMFFLLENHLLSNCSECLLGAGQLKEKIWDMIIVQKKYFLFSVEVGIWCKREIITADYADLGTGRKTANNERSSKIIFTRIGSNVAIWLANLPPPIRIQKTLLAPRCHEMVKHWRNRFIWLHYRG